MDRFPGRGSGWAEFFDCELRWWSKNIEGMRTPSGTPAVIGSAVHASTAVFDESRLEGNSPVTQDDAAEALMEYLKDPGEDVDMGVVTLDKAAKIGLGLHARYCNDIAPGQDYFAVEQLLDPLVIQLETSNGPCEIELTGTLDRIRKMEYAAVPQLGAEAETRYGIADVKTGARAVAQATGKHRPQIGVYELLAEHQTGLEMTLPGQIIALQSTENYQAALKPVDNAKALLIGDTENPGAIQIVAERLMSGNLTGNPNSILCSEKYCPNYEVCQWK